VVEEEMEQMEVMLTESGGNGRGWKSIVDSATTDITWIYLEKFF
jgi:hypothetical protein